MRFVVLASAVVLSTIGCKVKAPALLVDPGPAKLAQGWRTLASSDGKVSIGVPEGWGKSMPSLLPTMAESGIDTGNTQIGTEISAMRDKHDAELAKSLEAKGVLVTAYQQGTRPVVGEEITRYYVKRKHVGRAESMDEATEDFQKPNGKPLPSETATLPIGTARMFVQVKTLRDGGVVHEWTYVLPDKEDVYELVFVTEADAGPVDSIRTEVAKTLRIKR